MLGLIKGFSGKNSTSGTEVPSGYQDGGAAPVVDGGDVGRRSSILSGLNVLKGSDKNINNNNNNNRGDNPEEWPPGAPNNNYYNGNEQDAYLQGPYGRTRQVLSDMKRSILPRDLRIASITEALYEFDHKDKLRHDAELQLGAANVLYQKLAFTLMTNPLREPTNNNSTKNSIANIVQRTGTEDYGDEYENETKLVMNSSSSFSDAQADHEIAMLCTALEMVYRANDAAIERSYEEIGYEILPLIIRVIERPFQCLLNMQKQQQMQGKNNSSIHNLVHSSLGRDGIISKDQKVSVQKITKVLAGYSLLPSARYEMAHTPGLLTALVKIIDTSNANRMKQMMSSSNNDTDNNKIMGVNGIRTSLAGTGLLMTEAARFNVLACITNLGHADGNKITMLSEPGLIENISRIASNDMNDVARKCASIAIMNISNGDEDNVPNLTGNEFILDSLMRLMKDERPETRKNALISLYNIACSDENSDLLARHGGGIILDSLVEIVSGESMVHYNENGVFDADHSMRSKAAETIFNMCCSKNEITAARIANHPGLLEGISSVLKVRYVKIDTKMYCAASLRRMAEVVYTPMLCHGALLSALVRGAVFTKTDCIAQGFLAQATINHGHRRIMVEHHGLLKVLSNLASLDENTNNEVDEKCISDIKSVAITTIAKLSTEESTRHLMSRDEGIMLALTRFSYGDYHDGIVPATSSYGQDGAEYEDENAKSVKQALKNLVITL